MSNGWSSIASGLQSGDVGGSSVRSGQNVFRITVVRIANFLMRFDFYACSLSSAVPASLIENIATER